MQPKISVTITSYNQKTFLQEAMVSVLGQTLMPYEIVIVDDGSNDGSQELIKGYAAKHPQKIRAFYNSHNIGVAGTKAFAQKQITGEWQTHLDGDDRFLPEKLELEWLHAERRGLRAVFSNFYKINENGKRLYAWIENEEPPQGDVFKEVFARKYPRNTIFRNEMISAQCLSEIGYYDESRITHEDWDFKIRLTKATQVGYVPEILSEYRQNINGLSIKTPEYVRLQQMLEVFRSNRALIEDLDIGLQNEVIGTLRKLLVQKNKKAFLEKLKAKRVVSAMRDYLKYYLYLKFLMDR